MVEVCAIRAYVGVSWLGARLDCNSEDKDLSCARPSPPACRMSPILIALLVGKVFLSTGYFLRYVAAKDYLLLRTRFFLDPSASKIKRTIIDCRRAQGGW